MRIMKTQLAATPELRGNDAKKLLESLKNKPTDKSKENGDKLVSYFNKLEKEGGNRKNGV